MENIHNLIIIGSGPAGLTAGIYAARAELKPLVFAGLAYGGQLMQTTEVENFPGFPEGVFGADLMDKMLKQAQKFGAEVKFEDVTKVEFDQKYQEGDSKLPIHKVLVGDTEYLANTVIIATGAKPRKLEIKGEKEFWGKGVSSCATCDGAFYKEKIVAVIGGGDSAMEEANFLTKFAKKVYVIHRRDAFRASKIMIEKAKANPKVEFILNSQPKEVKGEVKVGSLLLEDTVTGKESEITLDGVFLAIGYIPETEIFSSSIDISATGYAKPSHNYYSMSKVPGVFIAGDVEDDRYRQAITAAADGCKAALDTEKWLAERE